MQTCDTVAKHTTPPLTLCRHITPMHDQVTTLCTPWTSPLVIVAKNSSAHALKSGDQRRKF